VGSQLDSDMVYLADAFRLSEGTRRALWEFDACTVEDFALMTNRDLETMLVTEARLGHPLPPLQQRKIGVLLEWLHQQVDRHVEDQRHQKQQVQGASRDVPVNVASMPGKSVCTAQSDEKKEENCSVHTPSDAAIQDGEGDNDGTGCKTAEAADQNRHVIVPPDWRLRFRHDLPSLKHRLREEGTSRASAVSGNSLVDLRWLVCGYSD